MWIDFRVVKCAIRRDVDDHSITNDIIGHTAVYFSTCISLVGPARNRLVAFTSFSMFHWKYLCVRNVLTEYGVPVLLSHHKLHGF